MNFSLLILALLFSETAEPRLLVVAPRDWKGSLDPYLELKRSQGLAPEFLDVERAMTGNPRDWGTNLRKFIAAKKPDYVFLVGDATKIPVIYDFNEIDWSPWTKTCGLYSDAFYAIPEGTTPSDPKLKGLTAAVGRLQAGNAWDVENYVAKAQQYHTQKAKRGRAFLLNDRAYDSTDGFLTHYAPMLAGIETDGWVVNSDPKAKSPFREATPKDLRAALEAGAPAVFYVGHGTAQMWGSGSLALRNVELSNAMPVPLVFAMACETAIGAPNIPWYPYNTEDQMYHDFTRYDSKKNGQITRKMVGDVHSLQCSTTTTENYSRRFTSQDRFGSMVYVGETIVTAADYDLLTSWLKQLSEAFKANDLSVRIGDIWRKTFATADPKKRPYFYQFVGDPSTPLIPPRR